MPHSNHGRVICKCGAVVSQCRCMDNQRVIRTVDKCPSCQNTTTVSGSDSTAGRTIKDILKVEEKG